MILNTDCQQRACPLVIVSHCLGKMPLAQRRFRAYEGVFERMVDSGHALLLSGDADTWRQRIRHPFGKARGVTIPSATSPTRTGTPTQW